MRLHQRLRRSVWRYQHMDTQGVPRISILESMPTQSIEYAPISVEIQLNPLAPGPLYLRPMSAVRVAQNMPGDWLNQSRIEEGKACI